MLQRFRYYIIFLILVIAIALLISMDPIPQDPAYHNFSDDRKIFGIPNFWNVMSNLPLFFIGLIGIHKSTENWPLRPDLVSKSIPLVLCLGIFVTCIGSAYYHLAPDNNTLIWDRMPMTLMFMPLFSLLIYDFIGKRAGQIAFFTLIPLGIFSVYYWKYTELAGVGDLRLYAFVQFFPIVIAPFIVWLFYKKTTYIKYIIYILIWYVLAKIAEHFDVEVFEFFNFWSGHTIKHLLASISLIYVLKLIVAWEKQLI